MRDVITVYDTEKHRLADKVRRLAELRGEGVSMNDVVRDHLGPAVDAELREWERVTRFVDRIPDASMDELTCCENALIDRSRDLSAAQTHQLNQIQAELKRRSKPTVG